MKGLFDDGIRLGWFEENPFKNCRGSSETSRSRDFYITPELAQQVLKACPDARMRLIFSFGRWGGLRIPSEIVFMTWADIQPDRITIKIPKKTGKAQQEQGEFATRFIPNFPEIRRAVEEYRREFVEKSGEKISDTAKIFPELKNSESCAALLRKQLADLLTRSGLPVWPKLFNNLRATRDTELQKMGFPIGTVCEWLGHTQAVSRKYYFQVPDFDYSSASRLESPTTTPGTLGDFTGENTGENTGE